MLMVFSQSSYDGLALYTFQRRFPDLQPIPVVS
jgi:hypothetical protein